MPDIRAALVLVLYIVAYVVAGNLIVQAWRDRRISSRSAALLRAGRWASIPAAAAVWQGSLWNPVALILILAMFCFSAVLHLRMFAWAEPKRDGSWP